MARIKVAIIGTGNAASIFLQGLEYYRDGKRKDGLWHQVVGGYHSSDIEVVGAFDIDAGKIGRKLSEAVFVPPNVVPKLVAVGSSVTVKSGLILDSPPSYLKPARSRNDRAGFERYLSDCGAEIVLNAISSGMDKSTLGYAEAASKNGLSFINCSPTIVASDRRQVKKFTDAESIVAGDDLMSQFGGTAFHKGILSFMHSRGIRVSKSYQLDVGGGSETANILNEQVKASKRSLKTRSISTELPYEFDIAAGTTDYVDYLGNQRTSYFWFKGEGFMASDMEVDVYLRTRDGPNAGNILIDVVRAVKTARDRGLKGAPMEICCFGFKNPPNKVPLGAALSKFEDSYVE